MSTTTRKILALILALALLTGSFFVIQKVNTSREKLGLTRSALPNQARPDLLTNVLFSVGRALAVDYLWIGLQKMQENGRYFDANQRAEWICQLQPHFPSVWIFQAWNMSYNISVAMNSGPDRWRWVKNGYELLRDQGIPLNPHSLSLYQQLAWIFSHKIGQMSDDQHWYYKAELAKAMEDILGGSNPNYDAICKAPATWDELMKDPAMAMFVNKFEEFQINPREKFIYILSHRDEAGEKVLAWIDDPANAEQRTMFEGFLRGQRLKNEWKMDPKVISEFLGDDMFGPLDFRTPQAHAIYWAYAGLKAAGKKNITIDSLAAGAGQKQAFEALNTERIIYACLQDLFRRGHFVLTPEGMPMIAPDIRFIPVVNRVYLALGKEEASQNNIPWDGTAGETFKSGHVNFLRKAVSTAYQYGSDSLAKKYWDMMLKMYPNPEYNIGMEAYVFKYTKEDIESSGMVDINATVVLFLTQAYVSYAAGDDYAAMAKEKLARFLYNQYMKDRLLKDPTGRMNMAPMADLQKYAQDTALKNLPEMLQERLKTRLHIKLEPAAVEEKAPSKGYIPMAR
jgi:hypothetical protein